MSQVEYPMHYGLSQSLIDVIGFGTGNYILHKASPSHMPNPSVPKIVIFGLSDLAIRNHWLSFIYDFTNPLTKDSTAPNSNIKTNAAIGLTSFVVASILDLVRGHEFGKAVVNNLILNGVGVATNEFLDRVLIPKEYV